ncbi:MAG: hypothetical protein HYX76_13965 [Acidobacteria bacterium]|nr:hypothetical protein [Acidobacteriota bacterium]
MIGLEAINCQTGDSLARDQVEVSEKEAVLRSLGAAASGIREKLGESLASIQKFDVPIERATTSSLDALYGNLAAARAGARRALEAAGGSRDIPASAAYVLALSGAAAQANAVVADLTREYPQDTLLGAVTVPLVRAITRLEVHPDEAIEVLLAAAPYETGDEARLRPIYIRGLAHLNAKRGREAAAEFRRVLEYRNHDPGSSLSALARDIGQSRRAYQDFLARWKEADPHIPVLEQARREYGRLAPGTSPLTGRGRP